MNDHFKELRCVLVTLVKLLWKINFYYLTCAVILMTEKGFIIFK